MGMSRRDFTLLMSSATAALAAPRAFAAPLKVRRGIQTLSPGELDVFGAGIREMKTLPIEDFRSWTYQADVHGDGTRIDPAETDFLTYWKQCKHDSPHFLTWHRWYLLFWEEIVRLARR